MCTSCFEIAELVHNPNFKPNPLISKAVFDTLDKMPFANEMEINDKAVFLITLGAYNLTWIGSQDNG